MTDHDVKRMLFGIRSDGVAELFVDGDGELDGAVSDVLADALETMALLIRAGDLVVSPTTMALRRQLEILVDEHGLSAVLTELGQVSNG